LRPTETDTELLDWVCENNKYFDIIPKLPSTGGEKRLPRRFVNGGTERRAAILQPREGRSEQGYPLLGTPSTDPDVRNYRIRLLPWVTNARRWLGYG
jgi:hypothetical protein